MTTEQTVCPRTPLLNGKNISVKVEQGYLIENIEFSLKAGELVAIIGPNGAGKTTLLNALCAEQATTTGSDIIFNGKALGNWLPKEKATRMAVLSQNNTLNFPYTVREVVTLGRIPHATGKDLDAHITAEALKALDISHISEKIFTRLSGGEKQRVQLARVLAQVWQVEKNVCDKPAILLLDEPCSALDPGHQHQLMRTLKEFCFDGNAVVMVLHDINLASRYADTLFALREGSLIASGGVDEVLTPKNMHTLFDMKFTSLVHPKYGHPVLL